MELWDRTQSQNLKLDWHSVWKAECVVSRGECEGSGVNGVVGQDAIAEFEDRLAFSMEGKMCGFTGGM